MKQTDHRVTALFLIIISSFSYAVEEIKQKVGCKRKTPSSFLAKLEKSKKPRLELQPLDELSKETKNKLHELLVTLKNPHLRIEDKKTVTKILKSVSQVSEQLKKLPDQLQEETKENFIKILKSSKGEEMDRVEDSQEHTLEQSTFIFLYKKNPLAEINDPRLLNIFLTLDEQTKKELFDYKNEKIFGKTKTIKSNPIFMLSRKYHRA